jgi:hypothetical protein
MRNEAYLPGISPTLYFELIHQLRKCGDMRDPDEIIALAIKSWLAEHIGNPGRRGYQWKELFLPDGSDLRMRYRGVWYYARVEGDELMYGGEALSPREWMELITGSIRNPWRDLWIRRSFHDTWARASAWREQNRDHPRPPGTERRIKGRRRSD